MTETPKSDFNQDGDDGHNDEPIILKHPAVDAAESTDDAACGADAFMDEADSDAVAERLRQLGYI